MGSCGGSGQVIKLLERFFYWWGCRVASHPWKLILAALLATALGSLGLLNFTSEADGWSYWLPEGSRHKTVQGRRTESLVKFDGFGFDEIAPPLYRMVHQVARYLLLKS